MKRTHTIAAALIATAAPLALACVGEFFDINQGLLAAVAFDANTDTILVYPDFQTDLYRYDRSGNLIETVPFGIQSSNDIDLDFAQVAFNLDGTPIPAGALIVANGDAGNAIIAHDPTTGAVIASMLIPNVTQSIVGIAQHASRGTFFALTWADDIVHEFDPADGTIINTFPVDSAGSPAFDIFYGDVEVEEATGNLFLVSSSQSLVRRMTADGTWIEDLQIPGLPNISGIAVDDARSELWVVDTDGRLVRMIDLFGCLADLTDDSVVDSGDLALFINLFLAGDDFADLTCDGVIDSGDLSLFITLFLAGC